MSERKDKSERGWAELDIDGEAGYEVDLGTSPDATTNEDDTSADTENQNKTQENQKLNTKNDDGNKAESRAQKRIRQLIEQNKQERTAREQAERERDEARTAVQTTTDSTVATLEKQVQTNLANLKARLKDAINNGDVDAQVDINEQLAELKVQERQIVQAKAQIARRPKPEDKPKVEQPQSDYPPQALAWVEENKDWWGKNRKKTAAAYALEAALREEGLDPTADEFYDELNNRLGEIFPNEDGEESDVKEKKTVTKATSKPQQMVAGGSRPPTKKVSFSQKEFSEAQRKWGFKDPAEYAKHKAQAEKAFETGGYTTLEI